MNLGPLVAPPLVALDGLQIPLEVLTPSALVGLAVLLVLTGRLVPRRTYDDKCHEAEQWRAESRIKDQQIHELTEQNTGLLHDFGPTILSLMQGIRKTADQSGGDES